MSKTSSISVVLGLALLLAVVGACSQPTPEERVAAARSRYEASVNGFVVEQKPMELPPELEPEAEEDAEGEGGGEAGEGADTETGEAGETGGEETEEEPFDLRQKVLLDIVIRHDSFEKLDGITVDVSMADGERELQVWRVWFDTSAIEKGPGSQFSHTLEDVDYQPGYGFSAEIRHPVPPEDRGQYREFSNLGG